MILSNLLHDIKYLFVKERLVYPIAVVAVFLLTIFSVYYRLRFTELGNEMKRVSTELEVYRAVNRNLETDIARLAYLPRIERFAKDSCNMKVAAENEKMVLMYEPVEIEGQGKINYMVCQVRRVAEDIIIPDKAYVRSY